MIDTDKIKSIVEASLLAADQPLTSEQLVKLFARGEMPRADVRELVKAALDELEGDSKGRGVELKRVASGYRMQVKQDLSPWVSRLWDEKPPRYSRALLETLALVAYRQPVTRGDIEQVRGVAVSQNIMRTLTERGWIKVVGQREVPGRPSMYGTTKDFLDYFNLQSLSELPPLAEIRDLIEPVVIEEALPPQTELKLVDDVTDVDPDSVGEGAGEGAVDSDAQAQAVADDEAAAVFAPEPEDAPQNLSEFPSEGSNQDPSEDDAQALAEDEMVEDADPQPASAEIEVAQDSVAEVEFAEDGAAEVDADALQGRQAGDQEDSQDPGPVSAEVVQLPRAPRG
jgi:segregation and condensation protein B